MLGHEAETRSATGQPHGCATKAAERRAAAPSMPGPKIRAFVSTEVDTTRAKSTQPLPHSAVSYSLYRATSSDQFLGSRIFDVTGPPWSPPPP
jgi:hypothetical protein